MAWIHRFGAAPPLAAVMAHIPIAMVSADANGADPDLAAASGCNEYFTKPIDTRTFAAAVGRLIGRGGPRKKT